jgi:Spy/CpxP family protein refolding chaperone
MQISRRSLIALFAASLSLAVAGAALAKGPGHGEPPDIDTQLAHMTERLALSDQQQEDIRSVLVEQRAKLEALHQQARDDGRSPELRDAMRDAWIETKERIEAQLTDEQVEQLRADHHNHRQHAGGGHGCGGSNGPQEDRL